MAKSRPRKDKAATTATPVDEIIDTSVPGASDTGELPIAPDVPAAEDARATREHHALIAKLEQRAKFGHSMDADRELLQEAALTIRFLIGLQPDSELSHIPKPSYAPVRNDPPIGHSLPYEFPK